MRVALITENSQKKKNAFIYRVLNKVAQKYEHVVYNYGVTLDNGMDMDYVGAGVLAGILLNSKAVDFVIMGCASGEGVMISANAMPNVFCGYVADVVDAKLFQRVNGGNAVSIPFGKFFGVGFEFLLESIFEALFQTEVLAGYPKERQEIQANQYQRLLEVKRASQLTMMSILEELDRDMIYNMVHNDYFEENYFADSCDDEMCEYLKDLIDAFEDVDLYENYEEIDDYEEE